MHCSDWSNLFEVFSLQQPTCCLGHWVDSWLLEVKHSFTCRVKGLGCKEAVVLCRWESEIKKRVNQVS